MRKLLLKTMLLLCALIVGSGTMWAAEETVTWTATAANNFGSTISSVNSSNTGTISTDEFTWNYTNTLTYLKSGKKDYQAFQNGFVQIGSSNAYHRLLLTTSAIPGTIKSISVECSSASAKHKLTVTVGNTKYIDNVATASGQPTTSGDYSQTGTGTSSGEISISFEPGSGALYIKSISVTYEEGGSTPTGPTVSFGTHTNVNLSMTDGDDNSLSSGASVAEGTTVKVYASAADGYKVTSVSAVDADDAPVTLTQNTDYWSFTMPTKNVTINATAVAKTDPALAFSEATASATLGQAFTAPTLTNTHNVSPISWMSDDAGVATVANGVVTLVGEGTATITASFAGDNDYLASEASYTLTVTDPSAITLWSEDFSSYSANEVPSGGTYGYTCTASGTKVYDATMAGGTTPELLVGKSGGTFTAVVPLNKASGTLTLTYKTNAKAMSVTTTTDGITGSGSSNTAGKHTVTFTGVTTSMESITIVFTATSSDNVRLDDIVLRGQAQAVTVEAPTFSINGGTYYTAQTVELSCATAGATIYYSTDDTNWTEYTQALTISTTTTLYAKAVKGSDESTHPSITITIAEKNDVVFNITNKTLAYGETYTVTCGNYNGRDVQSDGYVTAASNNAVATIDGLKITATAVGTATITLNVTEGNTYKQGTTTFTFTVTAPEGKTTALTATPLFYETFNDCDGQGGRDNTFTGNIGVTSTSDKLDENWTTIGSNGASQCIKLGTGNGTGTVTTSNIALTGNGTLTYSAAGWATGTNTVTVSATGATLSGDTEVAMNNGEWSDYTVNIEDAEGEVAITFTMKRGFLDDVKVIDNSAVAPAITATLNSAGYGTYCSEYPLDFSEATDYSAWYITETSGETITFEKVTGSVKGGTGLFLKGENGTTGDIELTSVNSSNTLSGNMLVGTLAPTYFAQDAIYGLAGSTFKHNNAGTFKANKAYIPASKIDNGSGVRAFTFVFVDPTTGITETRNVSAEEFGEIFNLAGQRMSKPQKGVNIINGKKVLVK